MEEYQKNRFREINAASRNAAIELMRLATQDPDGHEVFKTLSGTKAKPYSYEVLDQNKRVLGSVSDASDMVQMMMNLDMLAIGSSNDWKSFRFRPEALVFLREMHPLTEHEKREAIGRYFHRLSVGNDEFVQFNPESVAAETNLMPEDVTTTVRALAAEGYLRNVGRSRASLPAYYQMTQLGAQWALSGFRSDMLLSPTVNVNIELQQVIDVIAELPVSDEQRKVYELTALKLERELKQGRVSWGTVKDALSMASDSKEVAVPIVTVLAQNKDLILQAIQQLM